MDNPRVLADFHGECKSSGDQLCYRVCPVCGSDEWKLYVAPDTGLWKCFAGRHNAGGKVDVGLSASPQAAGQEILAALAPAEAGPIDWPELELPAWEPLSKVAKRYLRVRGIGDDDARKLGLVEQVDTHRVLVPFFDGTGQLIYYTARRYSDVLGHGPKYLTAPGKHPLFVLRPPLQFFVKGPEGATIATNPVALVEGVFDAIRVWQAGYPAIALCGKSLPTYLRADLLRSTLRNSTLLVMLDSDALGAAWALRDKLSHARAVAVCPLPAGHDPATLTTDQIRQLFARYT